MPGVAIEKHGQVFLHVPGCVDDVDGDNNETSGTCNQFLCPCAPLLQFAGSYDDSAVLDYVIWAIWTLAAIKCAKVVGQFDAVQPLVGKLLIVNSANGLVQFRSVKRRRVLKTDCIDIGLDIGREQSDLWGPR